MAEWELHDVGRTICAPVDGLYEDVIKYAHNFFSGQRADELVAAAKQREQKGTEHQQDFTDFCTIWVKTIEGGDFVLKPKKGHEDLVVPGTVVYKDSITFLAESKRRHLKIGLLTSGSDEFTRLMLNVPLQEESRVGDATNLNDLVDRPFRGEEWGDKDHKESHEKILYELARHGDSVILTYDDKISVCEAALSARTEHLRFGVRIVLMDREDRFKHIPFIYDPFKCRESLLRENGSYDKLSEKDKRVVRLFEVNPPHGFIPKFDVARNYEDFSQRDNAYSHKQSLFDDRGL